MSEPENLRIRKRPLEVNLALFGSEPRRVRLFLAEHGSHDFNRQRILDLLEQVDSFLPACDLGSGDCESFNSRAVAWIGVPLAPVEGEESAEELFEHRRRVRIVLFGALSLDGELLYSAPAEASRVVDLLNRKERFFRLWTEDQVYLVNKDSVLSVIEDDQAKDEPWRRSINF
jgi:hypothetical protein